MTMTTTTTILEATGNPIIIGAVKVDSMVTKHFTPETRSCPSNLSGEVKSDTLQIGGSYSSVDNLLVNYKAGFDWSNLVSLPKETKFTLRVLSRGSAMNMARIEVVVYEEDYTLQELNCLKDVKTLLEKYPKEMIINLL